MKNDPKTEELKNEGTKEHVRSASSSVPRFLGSSVFSFLAATFTPSVKFGKIPASTDVSTSAAGGQLLSTYIREIYAFGIGAGAFLAVVMVMWGGFLYITASGISSQAEKGKHAIQMAFLGLVILLTSYIMLQTINPAILTLKFPNIAPIKKIGEVPEFVPLPKISETQAGVAKDRGACLIVANSEGDQWFCIGNTSQAACTPGTGFSSLEKIWEPNYSCDSQQIRNRYSSVQMSGPFGSCTFNSGSAARPIIECYNSVSSSFCSAPGSTWKRDQVCPASAPTGASGACWEPIPITSRYSCSIKTDVECTKLNGKRATVPDAVWCGASTTCTAFPEAVKPQCG